MAETEYLKPSAVADVENEHIQACVNEILTKVTDKNNHKEVAIAIHNWVRDNIHFGFNASFWNMKASDVLSKRRGFCNNQSTLFVTLLRAAGIPARPFFIAINEKILHGFTSRAGVDGFVDHSFTQVWLDGRWINVDSYILDPSLFKASQDKLSQENLDMGYGTVKGGTMEWNGSESAFSQCLLADDGRPKIAGLTGKEYGPFCDVSDFYGQGNGVNGSVFTRMIFPVVFSSINGHIEDARAHGK
jgi:transglutaminase-like putative cysteine protease